MEQRKKSHPLLPKGTRNVRKETTNLRRSIGHIEEFLQTHKEKLWANPSAIKNCVLKAVVISVWPPYGLAFPQESKNFQIGIILFHQNRIIEKADSLNSSSRIRIQSKNISRYGIHNSRKVWHKQFKTGSEIWIRISLPLSECSGRWQKHNKKGNNSETTIKLSDFICYKAVKLWSMVDPSPNNKSNEEPVLRKKCVKFDQMRQFYFQWTIDNKFCLEQLLGDTTRKMFSEIVKDKDSFDVVSYNTRVECMSNRSSFKKPYNEIKKYEIKSIDPSVQESPTVSNHLNLIDDIRPNHLEYNNPIWIELAPIADNDNKCDKETGILNIQQSI